MNETADFLEKIFGPLASGLRPTVTEEQLDQYVRRRMNVELEQPINKLKAAVMLMASARVYGAEAGEHLFEEEGYYAIETMIHDAIDEIHGKIHA